MDEHQELPLDLKRALEDMSTGQEPLPIGLEDRVVSHLRFGTRTRARRIGWRSWIVGASAALVFFAAGLMIGRAAFPSSPSYDFVLLLEEGSSFRRPADAADEQRRVGEYRQWATGLRSEGVAISGLKLGEGAMTIGTPSGAETDLGGIFEIRGDEATARRIAATCPHLRYGGGVVIRPIAKT